MRILTQDEAQSVINLVCWKFGKPAARLNWQISGKAAKNGLQNNGMITIGPHTWRGLDCLLHEIAHYLAPPEFRNQYRSVHGKAFQRMLIKVAEFWYGDYQLYNWSTEYQRLRAYGSKVR